MKSPVFEFHVSENVRNLCGFDEVLFASSGNVIFTSLAQVRIFAQKYNEAVDKKKISGDKIGAGALNAMGLLDEIFHFVFALYRERVAPNSLEGLYASLDVAFKRQNLDLDGLLLRFTEEFPPFEVYKGKKSPAEYLSGKNGDVEAKYTVAEELILLVLANENPAFKPFFPLFSDKNLSKTKEYAVFISEMKAFFAQLPPFGPNDCDIITMLKEPVVFSPTSLRGQLDYCLSHWSDLLREWVRKLLGGLDLLSEEEKPGWSFDPGSLPDMEAYNYEFIQNEYERFTEDKDWMPKVVLMAKTVLVWLFQLSQKYSRDIHTLDAIPDEELDLLASQGFTGLWLIGVWERSYASERIKKINGNPEAAASAYSLEDYEIASGLGGWPAVENLRFRLWKRGIRLAADMVPNHTGLDSRWVAERPDLFMQRRDCPFPHYSFNGENLSLRPGLGIYLDDHYYSKTDCAVVFKRVDFNSGDVRYIYHSNDGTGLPWNDTAQIDFLNPAAREEVIQKILHVARNFPIIRFDAAMVLAKKHIRRLWYPAPGQGGDISTRSEYALTPDEFEAAIPEEFWREVVDRIAAEVPDTLLLAEAFWMMEGYFVRTLGMHRVYNSAFMNMLKKEENQKYRDTIKNTLEFDPQVLGRFVNFMNNPDEETAEAQFGKGDKYFGVCTLMVTMPGLPMFGHGQIEGFTEKYGMEYRRAYRDETPDQWLISRHEKDIFPLMKKRYLFAGAQNFLLYDFWQDGYVNENVFAYSNEANGEKSLVVYNNVYGQAFGWIKTSTRVACKTGDGVELRTKTLAEALHLQNRDDSYLIFTEQRSGLQFIRKSTEIIEKGMFFGLNGFESQVLLNLHEVIDDATQKYRILNETLAGKGVPDIEIAIQEIIFVKLYSAMDDFVSLQFLAEIAVLCDKKLQKVAKKIDFKVSADLKSLLKKMKPAGIKFFDTAASEVKEKIFDFNIQKAEKGKVGKKTSAMPKQIPSSKMWTEFEGRLTRLAEIVSENYGKKTALSAEMIATVASFLCIYGFQGALGNKATGKELGDFLQKWGLQRRARENAAKAADLLGCKTDFDYFSVMKRLVALCPEEKLAATMVNLCQGEFAWSTVGKNVFDGVTWFNAEKMAASLYIYRLVSEIFAESPEKKADGEKNFKTLEKSVKKANYDLDILMKDFFVSKKILKKNSAKKTSSAKGKSSSGAKKAPVKKKQ